MSNRGWSTFYRYPYRDTDSYTRVTQWFSSTWYRVFSRKFYFWQTKETDFWTMYDDSYYSSANMTWAKLLIIVGVFAIFLAIWKYFETGKSGDFRTNAYDSHATATEDTLSPMSNYDSDGQKSERRRIELQNVTDETYIQPFVIETSQTEHPKLTTVHGQKIIQNFNEKCKVCQSRTYKSVEFKWPHGPLQVFLTGSFLDWKAKVVLSRKRELTPHGGVDVFFVRFVLPKGHHEFKFLVEGVWRVSNEYKTCINQLGEENNYIILN